jgi:hypothetical protein
VIPILRSGDWDLVPGELRSYNGIDFRGDYDKAFQGLISALKQDVAPLGEFRTSLPVLPPTFWFRIAIWIMSDCEFSTIPHNPRW